MVLAQRTKFIGTIGEDVDVVDNGQGLFIGGLGEGGAAEQAGLVGGAALVTVNGQPVDGLDQVVDAAGSSSDGVVELGTSLDGAAVVTNASTWVRICR